MEFHTDYTLSMKLTLKFLLVIFFLQMYHFRGFFKFYYQSCNQGHARDGGNRWEITLKKEERGKKNEERRILFWFGLVTKCMYSIPFREHSINGYSQKNTGKYIKQVACLVSCLPLRYTVSIENHSLNTSGSILLLEYNYC